MSLTTFVTNQGLYCYKVMPFGLKNTGATYWMFSKQIGRNMEVYVDDMLVKSKEIKTHLEDIQETFDTLRRYRMKLNPEKWVFRVLLVKFLGFMVSQRRIEENPEKVKAILDMTSPRTVKEVQKLMGQVATINKFVLKATTKCLPLFKTHK